MSNNMAKIAEARKTVEQLKLEVNIDRMKVRRSVGEIVWGGGSAPGSVGGGAWEMRRSGRVGLDPGAWSDKAWSKYGAGIWAFAQGPSH